MQKRCSRCKKTKEVDEFHTNRSRSDGRNNYCKVCDKAYHHEHYLKRKTYYAEKQKRYADKFRKWFRQLKSNLSCAVCGENHPACLDFHHKDPTEKEFTIALGAANKLSKARVLAEIAKCIVLCSNCHRKKHYDGSHSSTG